MSTFITILISLRFYLDIMRKTPWMFCEAAGIYWSGKTKPLWEVVVNLVVSLILVKIIGMPGIFIGTIITIIVVDLPVEPYLVFKYVLNGGLLKYYLKYIKYLLVTVVMYTATFFTCGLVPSNYGIPGIWTFVLKAIIAIVVTNAIIVITMFKTEEFKYTIGLVKQYLKPVLKKLKLIKS